MKPYDICQSLRKLMVKAVSLNCSVFNQDKNPCIVQLKSPDKKSPAPHRIALFLRGFVVLKMIF
ncbi:MAG: hypothetical protein R2773_01230 [Flavobacteriaceae bacterium]